MTDAELRGRLLSHFYGLRHSNGGHVPVTGIILSGLEPISDETIAGVCRQLAEAGLIEWTAYLQGPTIGSARIRGPGVDAVERGGSASLEIRFPNAGPPELPAAMPAIKEPERINLVEGLALLTRHLPPDVAKERLRQAFVRGAFPQSPRFAFEYDQADIDWGTGSVKIQRKREAFFPTFSRTDFDAYFFEDDLVPSLPALSRKVFVVHGRDDGAKNEVALFLSSIGLEPIILHMRPNRGRHLLLKFQEESDGAGFAVVLITPDDEGALVGGTPQKRARQNVVFELGFFIGKLGAPNVAALGQGRCRKAV